MVDISQLTVVSTFVPLDAFGAMCAFLLILNFPKMHRQSRIFS